MPSPPFHCEVPSEREGWTFVAPAERRCLAVHRFGWPSGRWVYPNDEGAVKAEGMPWHPELIGRCFEDTPEGMMEFYRVVMGWSPPAPYALYVRRGALYQLAPLTAVTPHAKDWNRRAVALAVAGDFRDVPPTGEDWDAAVVAAAAVCRAFGWDPLEAGDAGASHRLVGHMALPGGTADPEKSCPGRCFDMDRLRKDVRSALGRPDLPTLMV